MLPRRYGRWWSARRTVSARVGCATFAVLATLALAGCSQGPMLGATTGYTESNAFVPIGYRSRAIDATHQAITVTGTPETPRARLEKIATARAAEIGKELKLAAFKVDGADPGASCGKKIDSYKTPGSGPVDYARLTLTVSYAERAPDATWLPSAETFDRLTAELAADSVGKDEAAAAAREVAFACGRK